MIKFLFKKVPENQCDQESKEVVKQAEKTWKNGFIHQAKEMLRQVRTPGISNPIADKLWERITQKEKEDYVNQLTEEVNEVLKSNDIEKIKSIIFELEKQDSAHPLLKIAKKTLKKRQIDQISSSIKESINCEDWAEALNGSNQLMSLEWNHSIAKWALKKVAKHKNEKNWENLITAEKPIKENQDSLYHFAFRSFIFLTLISSFIFYAINYDQQNFWLKLIDQKSFASQLHEKAMEAQEKVEEKMNLKRKWHAYENSVGNQRIQIIDEIKSTQLNWSALNKEINTVIEKSYPNQKLENSIFIRKVKYDPVSQKIEIEGILSDPEGNNLSKIAEIEEHFKYHPFSKESAEENTYFSKVVLKSELKKKKDSNEFKSFFNIELKINPDFNGK